MTNEEQARKVAEELACAIRTTYARFLSENPLINLYHTATEDLDKVHADAITTALLQFHQEQESNKQFEAAGEERHSGPDAPEDGNPGATAFTTAQSSSHTAPKESVDDWKQPGPAAASPFAVFFDMADKRIGHWKERHSIAVERAKWLEAKLKQESEAVRELIGGIEIVCRHARHDPECEYVLISKGRLTGKLRCTCGFEDARDKAAALIAKHSRKGA